MGRQAPPGAQRLAARARTARVAGLGEGAMDGARAEVTAMQRTARGLLGQGWPCKARDGSGRARGGDGVSARIIAPDLLGLDRAKSLGLLHRP